MRVPRRVRALLMPFNGHLVSTMILVAKRDEAGHRPAPRHPPEIEFGKPEKSDRC